MNKVWYYMKQDRQKFGPYTDAELVSLIREGVLSGNDYIWMTSLTGWLKISNSIYSFYLDPQS